MKKIVVGCTCLLSGVLLLGLCIVASSSRGYVDIAHSFYGAGFPCIIIAISGLIISGISLILSDFGLFKIFFSDQDDAHKE